MMVRQGDEETRQGDTTWVGFGGENQRIEAV